MRQILAFLAFNLYSGILVWAFQLNTPYLFDPKMIESLKGTGIDSPSHWGWGNHFIWRLFAAVISTMLAGILTGAIARTRGGLVAAISNVPSIGVWIFVIYYLSTGAAIAYGDQAITAHTGMIVAGCLAILLTTFVAYRSGEYGAQVQTAEFTDTTVLGIPAYHWVWLIAPIYFYAVAAIAPFANFVRFSFLSSEGIIPGIVGFVLLLTAIASVFPLIWVYNRLKIPAETAGALFLRGITNFGILTIGVVAVAIVQLASHYLLRGAASLF
jgi:hypothetical protein